MTMNEILRGRVKRHVDLFGQPPAADEPPATAETPAPSMNDLIRAQVRRYVIPDTPPQEPTE
jgi:hypothetical protein